MANTTRRTVGAVASSYCGFAAGFILATAARALLSTLFGLSLATLRLNITSAWVIALGAPALALVIPRTRATFIVATVATAAFPIVRFTPAFVPTAALATAAAVLALTQCGRAGMLGGLIGVAVNGAFLVAGRSADPALTGIGVIFIILIGAAATFPRMPPIRSPTSVPAAGAWAAIIVLQFAYFASPYTLAARLGTSAWTPALAGLAGLMVGVRTSGHRWFWLAAAVLAIADLAFIRSTIGLFSLVVVQGAVGACAARLPSPQPVVFSILLAAVAFFVVFFSQPLGAAEWQVLVLGLMLFSLVVGVVKRADRPARAPWTGAALAVLFVLPVLLPPTPVVEHEGRDVRVVTWNVHQGFGNRDGLDPEIYLSVLTRLKPDIVVLQESATTRYSSGGLDIVHLAAHELGLRIAASESDISILTRFSEAEGGSVSASWTAETAVDIHGTTVRVQGIHLARNRDDRTAQVQAVLATANATAGPRILAGDLNSCPAPTCFGGRPIDGIHGRLAIAYNDSWPGGDDGGFTHPAWAPSRRIDVIFTRGLDVISSAPVFDEDTRRASDHLPIMAVIRIREG